MALPIPFWLPTALLGAGVLLGARWAVLVLDASVNEKVLGKVLRKLLEAGDVVRALRLTNASAAPLSSATKAAVLACFTERDGDRAHAGYRGGAEVAPERILAPVRARYDEVFRQATARLRSARLFALVSLVLMVLSVLAALVAQDEAQTWVLVLAGIGLSSFFGIAVKDYRTITGRARLFEVLAPCLEVLARDGAGALAPDAANARRTVTFEVREPGREPRIVSTHKELIRIGTQAGSEVELDAPGVARVHAVIEVMIDNVVMIIDLGSENETRVNGEAVRRAALAEGDVITVGEATLHVRLDGI
ncbi:FHA domain-containing protein [Polyangium aurulentum]|uniref:FHA domain-containing protein n=1 Tax=Polyangium aurulentum TaxID=2567896 RepID=UPI0010AE1E4D|nr:FHA domain-containing protein [Polyangium aurulentum]UQA59792.1 FHA domain-containing protein [Polyangium aurulentum]